MSDISTVVCGFYHIPAKMATNLVYSPLFIETNPPKADKALSILCGSLWPKIPHIYPSSPDRRCFHTAGPIESCPKSPVIPRPKSAKSHHNSDLGFSRSRLSYSFTLIYPSTDLLIYTETFAPFRGRFCFGHSVF